MLCYLLIVLDIGEVMDGNHNFYFSQQMELLLSEMVWDKSMIWDKNDLWHVEKNVKQYWNRDEGITKEQKE